MKKKLLMKITKGCISLRSHALVAGRNAFEVMVGAILTQNTSWRNVEKAIQNLKARKVLHIKVSIN